LSNLTTYVDGVGLEDLEGCESFSKSNALAAITRYATRFHRQQAITTYLKNTGTLDASLTAVHLGFGRPPELRRAMAQFGVLFRDEFETWLAKEKAHLMSLSKEPLQETLEMEYYQKLVNLEEAE
ncbi:hypothetical protein B0H13DRAFT_1605660, partial [Mycena leptocephala]